MDIRADYLSIGRRLNYDTALALNSIGRLEHLFAGGYLPGGTRRYIKMLSYVFPIKQLKNMSLRSSALPENKCVSIWGHFLPAFFTRNAEDRYLVEVMAFSQIAGSRSRAPIVIACQTEALEAFTLAQKRKAKKILIMTGQTPIGRDNWIAPEYSKWGLDNINSLGPSENKKLIEREYAEIYVADIILSPSDFVSDSFTLLANPVIKPVYRINWPFGLNHISSKKRELPSNRKLRILFVGTMSLGKGIMYLTEALSQLSNDKYEAKFVGGGVLPGNLMDRCKRIAQVVGNVAYSEIHYYYDWADVFILPSLSEGRASVVLEAMTAGLPVIVTKNTGASVENGNNGIIIQARDSKAIIDAIYSLVNDPDFYARLSRSAIDTVKEFTMERYANELENVIEKI